MTTDSSSTVAATSDLKERVGRTLREATERITNERAGHIARLQSRIRDLESRGFIKRQEFSAPTTGDFERRFAYTKKG